MKIRIKHFLNSIFRYRIASVCFVVGQLIIYFSVFGALQIYNMASLKEEERKESIYDSRIKIEAVSTDNIDIFSGMSDNIEFGNMILSGRLVLPVKETGIASTTEIIIKGNEEFPYIMESGRLPGTGEDSGRLVAALGRERYKYTYEKNQSRYITICDEEYEVVGVVGGESDYWDNSIVLCIDNVGSKTLDEIISGSKYEMHLESNIYDIETLKLEYEDIFRFIVERDGRSNVNAVIDKSSGQSTTENTYARQKIEVNYIVYIFCLVNSVLVSYFWIEARKREIAIRKAFGFGNFKLIGMLFADVIKLMVFSLVIFLAVYAAGYRWLAGIMRIYINLPTFMRLLGAIFLTTIITVIYPVFSVIRMMPSKSVAGSDD